MKCKTLIFSVLVLSLTSNVMAAIDTPENLDPVPECPGQYICSGFKTEAECNAEPFCYWRPLAINLMINESFCNQDCRCYSSGSTCPARQACGTGLYAINGTPCQQCAVNQYLDYNEYSSSDSAFGRECKQCDSLPTAIKGNELTLRPCDASGPDSCSRTHSYTLPDGMSVNQSKNCANTTTCKGMEYTPSFEQLGGSDEKCSTSCPDHQRGTTIKIHKEPGKETVTSNVSAESGKSYVLDCTGTEYRLYYVNEFGSNEGKETVIGTEKWGAGFRGMFSIGNFETANSALKLSDWHATDIEMTKIDIGPLTQTKYDITGFTLEATNRKESNQIFILTETNGTGIMSKLLVWRLSGTNNGNKTFESDTRLYPYYTAKSFEVKYIGGNDTQQKTVTCEYNKYNGKFLTDDTAILLCPTLDYPSDWDIERGKVFAGWACYNKYGTDAQSACANMQMLTPEELANPDVSVTSDPAKVLQPGTPLSEYAGTTVSYYTLVPVWGRCGPGTYFKYPTDTEPTECEPGNYCTSCQIVICPPGTYCERPGMAAPEPCPGGTYCPDYMMTTTYDCTAGNFCPQTTDNTGQIIGAVAEITCPQGTYCGVKTPLPTPCDAGHYCPTTGLDAPIQCEAGYYCPEERVPVTWDGVSGIRGLINQKECEPKYFCPDPGLQDHQLCLPGYYCPDYKRTAGEACPPGTTSPAGSETKDACTYKTGDDGTQFCDSTNMCFYLPADATIH